MKSILMIVGLLSLSVISCGPSHKAYTIRSGAAFPSKGESCGLRFENMDVQEAKLKYQPLGMVSITGNSSDVLTDEEKKDVEAEACKIGADLATVHSMRPGMSQFLVWRAK